MVFNFYCEDCGRFRKGKIKSKHLRHESIIKCKSCKAKFVVFFNLTFKRLEKPLIFLTDKE